MHFLNTLVSKESIPPFPCFLQQAWAQLLPHPVKSAALASVQQIFQGYANNCWMILLKGFGMMENFNSLWSFTMMGAVLDLLGTLICSRYISWETTRVKESSDVQWMVMVLCWKGCKQKWSSKYFLLLILKSSKMIDMSSSFSIRIVWLWYIITFRNKLTVYFDSNVWVFLSTIAEERFKTTYCIL